MLRHFSGVLVEICVFLVHGRVTLELIIDWIVLDDVDHAIFSPQVDLVLLRAAFEFCLLLLSVEAVGRLGGRKHPQLGFDADCLVDDIRPGVDQRKACIFIDITPHGQGAPNMLGARGRDDHQQVVPDFEMCGHVDKHIRDEEMDSDLVLVITAHRGDLLWLSVGDDACSRCVGE